MKLANGGGGGFKTRMYGYAPMAGCLAIDFLQQEFGKPREKRFFNFFALKVFYVKARAKMLKISAGLPSAF